LNGKGEIHNVELNCSFLNEHISKISPFVELESVHVTKLSFHVSSWTNLRKAPIIIDIGDVEAVVHEPLHYLDRTQRRTIQQITKSELLRLIRQGLKPTRGAYNLFDRILDNLSVEIRSIAIYFQSWGKFKTRRPGPWTPPEIQMKMAGIRLVSVNEYGQEGPPEEVWRHNHHRSTGTFLIYKKLEMEYQIAIRPHGTDEVIPLISGHDNKMEIHLAMKRRIRDGEWLAVQVDTTIPRMEIDVPSHVVPLLAHTMAGVTYCMSKDRAFTDPLKAPSDTDATTEEDLHMSITLMETDIMDEEEGMDVSAEIPVDIDDDSSSSSSEDEAEIELVDQQDTKPEADASQTPQKSQPSQKQETWSSKVKDRPVILLPNGIVIHEKISMSLSVQQTTIRGTYAPSTDGYVQVVAKGCVTEAIWPKITQDKGGYAQVSVSYVSVQEKHGQRVRTVLVGGAQYDDTGPVEKPRTPLFEVTRDETFPLYEDRSVRQDPLGLRHTFPAQAFGLKTSVDFVKKLGDDGDEDDIQVLHEVGIDHFDIVLDTCALCRALRFALNEDGGGFDARSHTGDWSRALSRDMLVDPSTPLNLEDCLQPTKQLFLDENEFISSDLFNVTARMTDVTIRVPAAIKEDVRSCDIVVRMDETMLVVSSALPRTFLSGKIGSSIYGEEAKKKGIIDFPNDPSDVAYVLESSEDPSNRQRGIRTSRPISTFRLQLTLRRLSTRLVPVIPFCNAREPQQLLAPTELTMIICFEAEPPPSPESNLTKMVLFNSFEAHRFEVNFDFDLIASAIITVLHHAEVLQGALTACDALLSSSHIADRSGVVPNESSVDIAVQDGKIRRSMGGRRVLVRRQIHQSRQTEGLSIAFCFQVTELRFRLWRQNVPYSSLAQSRRRSEAVTAGHDKYIPLVRLMDFDVDGIELGLEGTFRRQHRRIVLKMCFSGMSLKALDSVSVLENGALRAAPGEQNQAEEKDGERDPAPGAHHLIEILGLGKDVLLEESSSIACETDDFAVAVRLEEQKEHSRSWSAAVDIEPGGVVDCRVEELESLALLVFAALLKPTWMKAERSTSAHPTKRAIFPDNTVGALILSLFPVVPSFDSFPSIEEEVRAALDSSGRVPVKSVDTILRNFIAKVVPSDVDLLLMRSHFSNMLVKVASQHSMGVSEENFGFGLLFHSADFRATYFASANALRRHSSILDVLARKGETWSNLTDNRGEGLRHALRSRQSLRSFLPGEGHLRTRDVLVLPFDFGYSYAKSKASLSVPRGLHVENVESLDEFLACMLSFTRRCKETMTNMREVVSAIRASNHPVQDDAGGEYEIFIQKANPVGIACSRTAKSIHSVRELLRRLNDKVKVHDLSLKALLLDKERQLKEMRVLNFMREKERIAALALVASQATGWLRIGAAQRTGQRGLMTCMLWPHWAVLRKSLLIAYAGPGRSKPIDIVALQGASLRQLAGGPRKRDLKRAFALVDRTGMARLVVASSDSEYFIWVRELQRAIDVSTPSDITGPTEDARAAMHNDESFDSHGGRTGLDSSIHSSTDGLSQSSGHGRPLGRSLSKAVQAAKATKQAVVDRSIRRKEIREKGSETIEPGPETPTSQTATSTVAASGITIASAEEPVMIRRQSEATTNEPLVQSDGSTPNKRLQLRNRFAGVSQATKSRFGSALQAAKQKGKEVAERRKQRMGEEEVHIHPTNRMPLDTTPSALSEPMLAKGDHLLAPETFSNAVGGSSWSCPACTFINPTQASICQICDKPKEQGSATSPYEVQVHDAAVSRQALDTRKISCPDEANLGERRSEARSMEESGEEDNEDGGDSYISDMADDFDPNDVGQSRRMRERLGAAVRSVRRGGESLGGSSRSSGRFSLRRRNASIREELADDSIRGAPSSMKLRNVMTVGPLVPLIHPFGEGYPQNLDMPLKRLEGSWYVRVEVESSAKATQVETAVSDLLRSSIDPGAPNQNENCVAQPQELTGSLPIADPSSAGRTNEAIEQKMSEENVGVSEEAESTALPNGGPAMEGSLGQVVSPNAQDETSEATAESATNDHTTGLEPAIPKPEESFLIQIFRQLGDEVAKKPVGEIFRKLDDILALHTSLSESVSSVPCAASLQIPERTSTGSMTESLVRVLGLTAIDTVRITGNLLGGLLASVTNHSVHSSLEHHGKSPSSNETALFLYFFLPLHDAKS